MYHRILVTLENSPYDEAILEHIRPLARMCNASLLLMHVADGWVARNIRQLNLRESDEMRRDRLYLEETARRLEAEGYDVEALLAGGDPAREIAEAAEREHCDLIAMSTHGHGLLGDLVYGSVSSGVHHRCRVPLLLVRGSPGAHPAERKST
ncbi:MAG TPA: universal stress protein [Gemmatimonadaceae bacterium]|nr:universal stress protein [Gemmatimonadaceae bacterium]